MEDRNGTRERILNEALALFSTKGFEPTTVADIAAAVHVKAPSLYKHYPNKQAIFDALLQRELSRHDSAKASMGFRSVNPVSDVDLYGKAGVDAIAALAVGLFRHWTTGDAGAFRRMLAAERLRLPEMARLYDDLLLKGPVAYQTQVFAGLMAAGAFRQADPQVLAVQFWGPILMLMERADCGEDMGELESLVTGHVTRFGMQNGTEGGNGEAC